MEWKSTIAIAMFLSSAAFCLADVLVDYFLFREYLTQWRYHDQCINDDTCWRWCNKYRSECDEMAPLGPESHLVAILTGAWIGLGGVFQFGVAVFLTARDKPDDPFKSLPLPIRSLILITATILLSPIVVSLYGAYSVFKNGITDNDMASVKIPIVSTSLKLAEIVLESVPQSVTVWFAAAAAILRSNPFSPAFRFEPLQMFSVVTSNLSILLGSVTFISVHRRASFVSRRHPPIASFVPITLWIILSVINGTVGFPLLFEYILMVFIVPEYRWGV